MNIHEPLAHAAEVYVDFNQDFTQCRTALIGNGRARSLLISISISRLQEMRSFRCQILESISISIIENRHRGTVP
jgi:hypothetical protein